MDSAEKAGIEKEFRTSLSKARLMMNSKLIQKDDLHKLYGLFQQATQGNCNDWKVLRNMNLVDLESKAKFNAWIALRGVSKHEAMQKYTVEVDLLASKYCVVFPASVLDSSSSSSSGPRGRIGSFKNRHGSSSSLSTVTTMLLPEGGGGSSSTSTETPPKSPNIPIPPPSPNPNTIPPEDLGESSSRGQGQEHEGEDNSDMPHPSRLSL